jgi:hypothetical protein
MVIRAVCLAGLFTLTLGCTRSPRTEVVAPAQAPVMPDITTLVLPTADSATLASLGASLDSLLQRAAFSPLALREPRVYALFRELEAAQESFNRSLSERDATGQNLYDRLRAQSDALAQLLDQLNRPPSRP